jgi:small-conductance mechanosensitive channel
MLQELARTFHLPPTLFYMLAFGTLLICALALGFALNRVLHHWTRRFQNTWTELVFALLESLPLPLLLLTAVYIGLELVTLPHRYERIGSKMILGLVLLVLFYFPAKVLIVSLRRMGQKDPQLERVAQPAALLIRTLFAVLAVIIFLDNLGISLTAVWTTLGVGSVAVALALQETLSNFFAGLYLMADRPISPGDYIKLDAGGEGYVVSMGWRSTSLRMLSNNIIVVPNSTLAKAVITNYSAPEPRMSYVLQVSTVYGADPRRVEKTLAEVAEEAVRDGVEGLLAHPAPFVRFIPGFGDSSLDFSLIVQVRQFTDQYLVQSDLRKRIVERFAKEGIGMPFPTRTVQLDEATLNALHKLGVRPDPPGN